MRRIIRNASVVGPDEVAHDQAVVIETGKIVEVCPVRQLGPTADEETFDAAGRRLAPGLIDLHTHGVHEFRVDGSPEDLAGMCGILPQYGVTGFLPTVVPRGRGADAEFLASLSQVHSDGTEILGFFLEGPFLSLTGALPPQALGGDDSQRVRSLIEAARPYKAIFGISPEFEGIVNLLRIMTDGGAPAFITHTAAGVGQTQAAIEAGARHATHFYDVFPQPEVTDPGVRPCGAVEAILADPRVTVDLILDSMHVDPVAVRMALNCKGAGGVSLITDASFGAGLAPGRYGAGAEEIEFAYEGAPARMTEKGPHPGYLAGSGLTLDRAVRNAVDMLDLPLAQAVRMAGANPARVLGLGQAKGQVAAGFDADLVLLDSDLRVARTWVGGRCVFDRGPDARPA